MAEPRPRILIVDDDPTLGHVMQSGLQSHGFEVRYEAHSSNALQAGLEFQPDLVLLDVNMPAKDGGEVAAEIRRHPHLQGVQLIYLTSIVNREEAAERTAGGGDTFLSKPLPIGELVSAIQKHLARRPRP